MTVRPPPPAHARRLQRMCLRQTLRQSLRTRILPRRECGFESKSGSRSIISNIKARESENAISFKDDAGKRKIVPTVEPFAKRSLALSSNIFSVSWFYSVVVEFGFMASHSLTSVCELEPLSLMARRSVARPRQNLF
jgi:hypothetical protein